jgi:hypothetical protein
MVMIHDIVHTFEVRFVPKSGFPTGKGFPISGIPSLLENLFPGSLGKCTQSKKYVFYSM